MSGMISSETVATHCDPRAESEMVNPTVALY